MGNIRIRSLSCASIATIACLSLTPANAQADAAVSSSSGASTGTISSSDADNAEIVVTAQRREQRLQDVPVSVSVVTGAALENAGIRGVQDLAARLPNLNIVEGPASDLLNIRGVGSGLNTGFEQSVGTFVDGVYRGRGRAIRAALFDLEQVEVLKGPQSTFFGNNAIAGAINITTRKPSNKLEYNASVLYAGQSSEYALEGGVSVPLSDSLAVRAAGRLSGNDGYIYNSLLDREEPRVREKVGRVSARFEPSALFRSDLRIDAGETNTRGAFPWEIVHCPPDAIYGAAAGPCAGYLAQAGGVIDDNLNYKAALQDTYFKYHFFETAWTNTLDVGDHSLTSITSYFDHRSSQLLQLVPTPTTFDNGGGLLPTAQGEHYRQFTQEVRLQSPTGGLFEYMVGAYYSRGKLDAPLQIALNIIPWGAIPLTAPYYTSGTAVGAKVDFDQRDTTASAFASATIRPVERLRINLGLRYTVVHKEAHRISQLGTIGAVPTAENFTRFAAPIEQIFQLVAGSNLHEFADTARTDRKLQPSVGVQYDLTDEVMAYATYTKGFKAGGFSATSQGEVFNPETVNSYEIGLKSSLLDRRMTFNIAAFQMDYKDLQESTYVFLDSGTILSVIGNAAEARSKGIELGSSLRLSRHFSLNADIAYLDSIYTHYPTGACTVLQTQQIGASCIQDLSGKQRPFAPEWSGSVGASLSFPVHNLEARLDPLVYFTSGFFQSSSADDLIRQKGFAKVDLRAAIGPANQSWELALIGKNLTDKLTASFRNPVSSAPGSIAVMPERPRSVAVQFSIRY